MKEGNSPKDNALIRDGKGGPQTIADVTEQRRNRMYAYSSTFCLSNGWYGCSVCVF